MIKLLTFCFALFLSVNIQADTTDSKWKNTIELKKTGDHCKDDENCFNRYHPEIKPRAEAKPGDIIVLHTRDALDSKVGTSSATASKLKLLSRASLVCNTIMSPGFASALGLISG